MSVRARSAAYLVLLATTLLAPGVAFPQRACVYTSFALPDSVVPPLQGQGWAHMLLLDDRGDCDSADSVYLHVNYGNLESNVNGASIHRGAVGQNGDEVLSLFTELFETNTNVRKYLDPAVCREILNPEGAFYFIVKTVDHPDGAVRGQVWVDRQSPVSRATWGRVKCSYR
jgi:hypothetical protein